MPTKGELYDFADWETGEVTGLPGVFGLGNVLTGKGNIKDSRNNAVEIIERVGSDVNFVITGHSHLARAFPAAPSRYYFNCGTWIRLIRLTMQSLRPDAFPQTYAALKSGTLGELDDAEIQGPEGMQKLVLDRANTVRIAAEDGRVVGRLLQVTDGAKRGEVSLSPQSGTTEFKV